MRNSHRVFTNVLQRAVQIARTFNDQCQDTTRANAGGVLADVDNDGFAEESDWVGGKEGIFVADLDGDNIIKTGHEMFSDSRVNMQARGLTVLRKIEIQQMEETQQEKGHYYFNSKLCPPNMREVPKKIMKTDRQAANDQSWGIAA
jgi:hypothetical protein